MSKSFSPISEIIKINLLSYNIKCHVKELFQSWSIFISLAVWDAALFNLHICINVKKI